MNCLETVEKKRNDFQLFQFTSTYIFGQAKELHMYVSVCVCVYGAVPHEFGVGVRSPHLLLVVDILNKVKEVHEDLQRGVHIARLPQVGEP